MSGQGYQFTTLRAVESVSAARAVVRFAEKLHADQARTWEERRSLEQENKPRPATWQECLDKSRETRIRRERDSTYWNDLVSARPIH
jgi:hypothetical protein